MVILDKFFVNTAMCGSAPSGLGIYAQSCAGCLEKHFELSLLTSYYRPILDARVVPAPRNIAIGSGRYAALNRFLYTLFSRPFSRNAFVYSPAHTGFLGYDNQVITILDLICLHYPEQHRLQNYFFRFVLPAVVKRSRAVFTISETARQDICRNYNILEKNVYVIPCGVESKVFKPARERHPDPYLLLVGAGYPHKNVEEVLFRWSLWKGRYRLKIAGARGRHGEKLKNLAAQLGLVEEVDFLGYVSTEELVRLYQGCIALVYPSLWEGFGMPPLEAMACGRPVIVSDIPVHREVLGETAMYVRLGDESSWEQAFATLADEEKMHASAAAGLAKAHLYSWERSCTKLITALLAVEPALKKFVR